MEKELFKDVFPGLYIGTVEYINDPAQLGRVKVRVHDIYGQENVSTESLPWALPCIAYGGGPGFGSLMIPPEGATVFVSFRKGDPMYPVYMGTFYGNPDHNQIFLTNNTGTLPDDPVSMGMWETNPGPELPREALIQSNNRPERLIPFKTIKGASIDINEKDEEERFAIHDRAGQAIVFDANVTKERNYGNQSARDLRSSFEGDAIPVSSTLAKEGTINIVDIGGQSIVLHTKIDNSRITLLSKDSDSEISSQKEIEGDASIIFDLASGEKKVTLEIKEKGISKAKFVLDGNTGFLEIVSNLLVKINSQNILLNGNTTVDGDLTVTKSIFSLNDKII